jgi:hypothetical protein
MFINKRRIATLLLSTAVLSSLLLTGCGPKPKPRSHQVQRTQVQKTIVQEPVEITPAELDLSSDMINTNVKKVRDLKQYDLTIYLDNYTNASAYVNLSNEGGSILKLSDIQFKSEKKNLFSLVKECSKTIEPDDTCKLKVSFNGKKKGVFTADIIIKSNSNGRYIGRTGKVHVIATAKDRVTGLVKIIEKPVQKSVKKPIINLDFVGNDLTQYLEIKNNGIENINIKDFELIGKDKYYFTVMQSCPKVLKSGRSCNLQIKYRKKLNSTALSYLVIHSNGTLSPSDTIRLRGKGTVDKKAPKILKLADHDDMFIGITDVNVKTNTQNFLEDFHNVKPVYYFRTMYQTNTDSKFKEYFENTIAYYFQKNGFRVTRDASKADKILNIYPSFSVKQNSKRSLTIATNIKVNIVTKSFQSKAIHEELEFSVLVKAKNYSDIYFVYAAGSNLINSFMFNLLGLKD